MLLISTLQHSPGERLTQRSVRPYTTSEAPMNNAKTHPAFFTVLFATAIFLLAAPAAWGGGVKVTGNLRINQKL